MSASDQISPNKVFGKNPEGSTTDEWYTPRWIIDALGGKFQLDPCAPQRTWHTAHKCFTREDDGLKQDWGNNLVFLNPPYSNSGPWIEKMVNKHHHGIVLVFVRSDAKWMQVHALCSQFMLLIQGRIKFERGDASGNAQAVEFKSAPAPSVLLAYGDEAEQRLAYAFMRNKIPGRAVRDLLPDDVYNEVLNKPNDPEIFREWPHLDPANQTEEVHSAWLESLAQIDAFEEEMAPTPGAGRPRRSSKIENSRSE